MSNQTQKETAGALTCALDLSGSQIIAALVDEKGRIVSSRQSPFPAVRGKSLIPAIGSALIEIAAAAERGEQELHSVGVCIPGAIDPTSGRIHAPSLGWDRLILPDLLHPSLVEAGVDIRRGAVSRRARADKAAAAHPVFGIVPEHIAGALAESWLGAAKTKQNVLYVNLPFHQKVGMTAGILVEGKILNGVSGNAGAMGWLAMTEQFREEYGGRGCLETESSAVALVRRVIETWSGESDSAFSQLVSEHPDQITPDAVLRAARADDTLALSAITDVCRLLGRAVAGLLSILNPEVLIIGGEFGVLLRPYLPDIRREARQWAHPQTGRQCRILSATLGKNTGLLGAVRFTTLNPSS